MDNLPIFGPRESPARDLRILQSNICHPVSIFRRHHQKVKFEEYSFFSTHQIFDGHDPALIFFPLTLESCTIGRNLCLHVYIIHTHYYTRHLYLSSQKHKLQKLQTPSTVLISYFTLLCLIAVFI